MSGIVLILQKNSLYAREIGQVLPWFYKYLLSMLEGYVRYILYLFYKYLVSMLEGYDMYFHDFANV